MDRYEALIDEADNTRKDIIRCPWCNELTHHGCEDHEMTDCVLCERTTHRCVAEEVGGNFPACHDCWTAEHEDRNIEDDPRYGDWVDERIDDLKEARREERGI